MGQKTQYIDNLDELSKEDKLLVMKGFREQLIEMYETSRRERIDATLWGRTAKFFKHPTT